MVCLRTVVWLGLGALLAFAVRGGAAAPPWRWPADKLHQRNLYSAESSRLERDGKLMEAIAAAEKMLAVERQVLGEVHVDVSGSLSRLGRMHERQGNLAAAALARQQELACLERLYGGNHWLTVEAWLTLTRVRSLERLSREQRVELDRASEQFQRAVKWLREGKAHEALAAARQAVEVRKRLLGERHSQYPTDLGNLASFESAAGNRKEAIELSQKALAIRKETLGANHPLVAQDLNTLGVLYFNSGNYKEALPQFELAVTIYRKAKWQKHYAYLTALDNLAAVCRAVGKGREALPLCKESLATREAELGEKHPATIAAITRLAGLHMALGNYREALPLRKQLVAIYQQTVGEKHLLYAGSLLDLASVYKNLKENKPAVQMYNQALAIRKELAGEKNSAYANGLDSLAGCYWELGEFRLAHDLCKRALELQKDLVGEKHPAYAHSLDSMALVYISLGDYDLALPLARKSVEIYKAAYGEKNLGYCYSLNTLAFLNLVRGEKKVGLEQLQRVEELSKAVLGEDHPEYLHFLSNLVNCSEDRDGRLPLQQKILALRKKLLGEKHPDYAMTLESLAGLYRERKQYSTAERLYQQALALLKEANGEKTAYYAYCLRSLAVLYLTQNDPAKARPLVEKALTIKRGHMRLAASAESERQQLLGLSLLRDFLDLGLTLPDRTGQEASDTYSHVLAWKGIVFMQQKQRRLFARLRAADNRADVRRLAGELEQTTRLLSAAALAAVGEKEQAAHANRMEMLTRQKEDLERQLTRLSADFHTGQKRDELTTAAFRQVLPADVALVDFLFYTHHDYARSESQRRLTAFVLRKDHPVVRLNLGPAAVVEQAVASWRRTMGMKHQGKEDAGQALCKLLWLPLEKHLAGAKVVLLSPDGALAKLPFAALPGTKEGTYLLEEIALAVVPVPQLLPDLLAPVAKEKRLKPSLLVVGDVNFDSTETVAASADDRSPPRSGLKGWARLIATADEAAAVKNSFSRLFRGGDVADLYGELARKSSVRAALQKSRYAHLATHGFFAPEELKSALALRSREERLFGENGVSGWHPLLLSGVVLAGANRPPKPGEEDGILTALEVSEMDLSHLELAVLSACETGLGQEASGEGLLGLQRAFQVAGTRSVVASLWKVPDRETQALMAEFYRVAWGKTVVSRVEALRQAQLTMLREGDKRGMVRRDKEDKNKRVPPYYWAAFVLSGDWR